MTQHEQFRELLALAAAGALEPEEMRRIEQHAAACAECAQGMEVWRALLQDLRRLPTPQPRAEVVERARALAEARLRQAAEERSSLRMVIFLGAFAWVLLVASWPLYHLLTGGVLEGYAPRLVQGWMGFAVWTGLAWLAAGVAAVLVAAQQQRERGLA